MREVETTLDSFVSLVIDNAPSNYPEFSPNQIIWNDELWNRKLDELEEHGIPYLILVVHDLMEYVYTNGHHGVWQSYICHIRNPISAMHWGEKH